MRFPSLIILLLMVCSPCLAQNNNNNNNNVGGIEINAEGVIRSTTQPRRPSAALQRKQAELAAETLPADIVVSSPTRTLSLKQLEAQVAEALQAQQEIPVEVFYLAGLQRIDHVVISPDDVLISGPAEGFAEDPDKRMVGIETGRPPMQLDDLVIALRAAEAGVRSIGCSIDPTPDNMAALQNYIRQNSFPVSTARAQQRFRTMGKVLGMQEISVHGVPENSHFALALVEADFRMKRISLGVEASGLREVRSHLSLLAPQGNSLQRWWFMPLYDPVQVSQDGNVFALSGQRAQLMAQEEISDNQGNRSDAATTRQSTERFAQLFTQHFQELADQSPIFAELQSLYDMAVLAELIKAEFWPKNPDWDMATFLRADGLPVNSYVEPKYVPSDSTFRKARGSLIGLIGGVTINPRSVISNTEPAPRLFKENFEAPSQDHNWYWSPQTIEQ